MRELNQSGLTAFGSAGCEADVLPLYRRWAAQRQLNVRVFCITRRPAAAAVTPAAIAQMKLFQGDSYIDHVAFGESVYGPLHDPMFMPRRRARRRTSSRSGAASPPEIAQGAAAAARARQPDDTIDAFLDQIEAVNKEYPIRTCAGCWRTSTSSNAAQLERMKKLGMYAAVHPWAVINGGINRRVFGDAAYDMAPLATIQKSGITWGFGSDGSRANQILPFETLCWAVTGKMVGGTTVLRQTISREDALDRAHAQERVPRVPGERPRLDRAGQARGPRRARSRLPDGAGRPDQGHHAVMTMVGGRVVHKQDPF